jgi:amino acid transporter
VQPFEREAAADGVIGFGIATNLACLSPEFGGKLPLLPVEQLANVFYTLTASMTIILTSMICFKLLRHRRLMAHKSDAFRDHRSTYLSIVGILVESAVPYAACCWIWVVLSITNNPAVDWFDGVITAASVCCPCWDPSMYADAVVVLSPVLDCPPYRDGSLIPFESASAPAGNPKLEHAHAIAQHADRRINDDRRASHDSKVLTTSLLIGDLVFSQVRL